MWTSMAMTWISADLPLLIVYYKDLRDNPTRELLRMVKFLKQPIDLIRIQCAVFENPLREHRFNFRLPVRDISMHHYIATVNETLMSFDSRPLPCYGST